MDWNDVAQDRDQWWAVMSTVMSLSGSKNLGTFRDWVTVRFSRINPLNIFSQLGIQYSPCVSEHNRNPAGDN